MISAFMLLLRKHLWHQSMFLLPNSCRNFVIATDFFFPKMFQKQKLFRFNFMESYFFIYQVFLFKRRWFCNDISCFQFMSLEVTKDSTRSMTRKSRVYRAFKTRLMTKKKTILPDSLFAASAFLKISHCCFPWPCTDTDHKSSVISLLRSIPVVRLCYRMFYLD